MGKRILVPSDRTTQARVLDPHRFVKRHKVVAINSGRNTQQIWMTISAQTGLGKLQRTQHQLQDMLGRAVWRIRLNHLSRMTTIGMRCTA